MVMQIHMALKDLLVRSTAHSQRLCWVLGLFGMCFYAKCVT